MCNSTIDNISQKITKNLFCFCIFLYFSGTLSAQSSVTVSVGSSAVLHCDFKPIASSQLSEQSPYIEWKTTSQTVFERLGEVHIHGEGYEGRVDVPEDKLKKGNCSLVLKEVKAEDAGIYESYLVVKRSKRSIQTKWVFIQSVELSVNDSTKALQENPKPHNLSVEAPPDVQVFANKSVRDSRKLILTCLITGFYHKDVKMSLRKYGTSFPDHLITSSEIGPNDDGTYQLRKSVEISDDDPADYYCFVSHSSLTEPVIKKWDGRCIDCPNSLGAIVGGSVSGVVVVLCPVIFFVVMIIKKRLSCSRRCPNLSGII
ncbi:class II histocompatibility antigen, B-L beta chain-like [Astyanax mexicanus]|uniref:Class II histocompatibility antigen, B-L beta chain-like n=1 Tax=Astyanax mexicanus TaxID=7994 RepID=A0A8T2MBK6_ASTMX|nr:class II histocompatibility antigen, B-L beta chain-like [Astyanax mexicanus]